jgi:HEAT repeat protein
MKDIKEIIKDLNSKDSSIRQNAVLTLGMMKDESAVDALVLVLKDKNRFLRQEAITALGKIGGARLEASLNQALIEEKDEFVRESLKKLLEKLHSKE